VHIRTAGVLGDIATATAGFRDQYYGLVDHVREAAVPDGAAPGRPVVGPHEAALVTAGLLGPARCAWGVQPARFARRWWARPVVDLEALAAADPRLSAWVRARLVPKAVVAAQSRVIEAALDADGTWCPSVPVVAVAPRDGAPETLGRVLSVLLAPASTAHALRQHGGAGLSADALRLPASALLRLPLPAGARDWDEGAALIGAAVAEVDATISRALLLEAGRVLNAAYQARDPHELHAWWAARLPCHPTATVS
jgi:hypothetical protein